ncbi:TIGR03809 family protein [Bradyrhizobium sp. GCM10027634]|uniref:TIGR03809 family protein n=1 Tax=unclassified Bradyrhizobium TaxID=2631580 RepID=UPI00188A2749|nr:MULTISPECIES: TIGR03809 family protein [unclassified Bradyrhizobium]MDN5005179.1 TIGR03809 family protein [Bradyrhizobium sp. WYCCWR 12677]QOZ48938.1 TIGR03809 family protein [Bradyrhizobium sp. CCBAU 53340]
MTHRQESVGAAAAGRDIAARWCALAEQRLEHLSEMFETGRWRRYHSEIAFLENIQEAKRAVETWRALATGGDVAAAAASVTSAFGWSPATMPRVFPREQAQTVQPQILQPKAVHIAPETSVPVRLEPKPDVLAEIVEAPIAPVAPVAPIARPARIAPAAPPAPIARKTAPAAPIAPVAPAAPSIASFLQTFSPPADEIVAAPERVVEFTFSLDGIEAKYPLLRNSF